MLNKITAFTSLVLLTALIGCGKPQNLTGQTQAFDKSQVGRVFDLQSVVYNNNSQPIFVAHFGDMSMQINNLDGLTGNIYCNAFSVATAWGDKGLIRTSHFQQGTAVCPGKPAIAPFSFSDTMRYEQPTPIQLQISDSDGSFTATFLRR